MGQLQEAHRSPPSRSLKNGKREGSACDDRRSHLKERGGESPPFWRHNSSDDDGGIREVTDVLPLFMLKE